MSLVNYTWYKIFNKDDFDALGLPSVEYTVIFEGIGEKTIVAFQGNRLSVLFDDIFLTVNLNSNNPFELDSRGVYIDANNDVYVGILDAS